MKVHAIERRCSCAFERAGRYKKALTPRGEERPLPHLRARREGLRGGPGLRLRGARPAPGRHARDDPAPTIHLLDPPVQLSITRRRSRDVLLHVVAPLHARVHDCGTDSAWRGMGYTRPSCGASSRRLRIKSPRLRSTPPRKKSGSKPPLTSSRRSGP